MQQLKLHDLELYLEGMQVVAMGSKATGTAIVFDQLRTDTVVVNSTDYPTVFDGKRFTVEYHPDFDHVPALIDINCDYTVSDKVQMVVQPGLMDFMVKYLKNPVTVEIGIHQQRVRANQELMRTELISFAVRESLRYDAHAQAVIIKMLRMLTILGDKTTFDRLKKTTEDDQIDFLQYGDMSTYAQVVQTLVGLLLGKYDLADTGAVNWWEFPVTDAQPIGTVEMHDWCVANGFTFKL
jgi:hypothetical protein